MNWELINKLLDSLDTAANSNSFWLAFGLPKGIFDLNKTLVQHLRTGNFHFELVKQDIQREWYHYSEKITFKDQEPIGLIQKPGNTWNGTEHLDFKLLSSTEVKEHLIDLLTGQKKIYSKSSAGTPLQIEAAVAMIGNLVKMLSNTDQNWQCFLIKPNFLSQVEDYYNSGYIQLGYFENYGRDLALAFLVNDSLYVLLTNGYG